MIRFLKRLNISEYFSSAALFSAIYAESQKMSKGLPSSDPS